MAKGKKRKTAKNSNYITKADLVEEKKTEVEEFEKGFKPIHYAKKPAVIIFVCVLAAFAVACIVLTNMGILGGPLS